MEEKIEIGKVDNFYNNIQETEISDISKIIQEMIQIKNSDHKLEKKKTKPYSINDKIKLNKMSFNVATRINKYHIESYDIVDEALSCISEYEPSIANDLYDYYFEVYIDVLTELEISGDDIETIKENVDKIYNTMLGKVKHQIFDCKKTTIPTNKQVTYIGAITAYVFYKCKFLIPIENNGSLFSENIGIGSSTG